MVNTAENTAEESFGSNLAESRATSAGGPKSKEGKRRSSANATRHGLLSVRPVVNGMENLGDWEDHRVGILASLSPSGHLEEVLAERIATQLWRLRRVVRYEREAIESNLELVDAGYLRTGDVSNIEFHRRRTVEDATESRKKAELIGSTLENVAALAPDEPVDREAAVAVVWAAYESAFQLGQVEISIPGVPDDDDEFNAFDGWTAGLLRTALSTYATAADLTQAQLVARTMAQTGKEYWRAREEIESKKRERRLARRQNSLPAEATIDKIVRYEASLERSFVRNLHELQRLQAYRQGAPVTAPAAIDLTVSAGADAPGQKVALGSDGF